MVVARKLTRNEGVPLGKPIKDSVGGKSVMQNKTPSGLQLGFGSIPRKGEKPPDEEVSSAL